MRNVSEKMFLLAFLFTYLSHAPEEMGEAEIGSGHLAEFLRAHHDRLKADVLVLSDTANFATGLPSITTSLRGMVIVDVRVRALDHPIHSGMWGGPVPDAATSLSRILSRLFDDDGNVAIPEFESDLAPPSDAARARLEALPIVDEEFRAPISLSRASSILTL